MIWQSHLEGHEKEMSGESMSSRGVESSGCQGDACMSNQEPFIAQAAQYQAARFRR